jgi:hypothetical protein
MKKSTLIQHACEEGGRIGWNEASILCTETDSRYMKCEESTHIPSAYPLSSFLHMNSLISKEKSKVIEKSRGIFRFLMLTP